MINDDKKTKKPYETAQVVLCGGSVSDVLAVSDYENDGNDIIWSD